MKKLSSKRYWSKFYNQEGFNNYSPIRSFFSYSLQNFEYFNIIKKYLKKEDKNIMEIGCAPAIYLIKAHRILGLIPYGVDYTENGKELSETNLRNNGVKKFKIFCSDVFSKDFQKRNKNKYDIVFSNGFVEHFDNYKKTLESHINITRPGGKVIFCIPNLEGIYKFFLKKNLLAIHNLEIMSPEYLKDNLPNTLKLEEVGYYGGLFNLGIFPPLENTILDFFRKVVFIGQRLFLEPIFIALSYFGIRLNWKFSSPGIYLVAIKKNEKEA